ncbi:hypothetical protein HHK36_004220 [Tetracentron sinense]|uniref:Receptor-like serine/threonine-protein kinase n=1 Tax=Tetracentron sinense TaxID=13715 RepID=A0A835DT79_TETSI|nr:hypothetical protein HHK36_004220 [Tetracentron sinense]
MASVPVVVFLLFLLVLSVAEADQIISLISLGSSLSPTVQPTSWPSPSGHFAFGFYPQGNNSFMVGIWLLDTPNRTVVWTANRDDPPVSSNAKLSLTKHGKLVLLTDQGEGKSITNVADSASSASMLDSGNFVLYKNSSNLTIWESFDDPTDTILGGQNLFSGDKLISSVSRTDPTTGRFQLSMQGDGNLVAYPVNSSQASDDSYWSSGTFDSDGQLNLNNRGLLSLRNSSGFIIRIVVNSPSSSNRNMTIIYRATLDPDGIFRLYSHSFERDGSSTMSIEWPELQNQCQVNGFCGFNSFCTLVGTKSADCHCFPGFDYIDPSQRFGGCERSFMEENCRDSEAPETVKYSISTVENVTWSDYPYSVVSMKKEDCGNSCLKDCNCGVAYFHNGSCKMQKLPLRYGRRNENASTIAFFKLLNLGSVENSSDTPPLLPIKPIVVVDSKKTLLLILVVSLGLVTFLCFVCAIVSFFIYRHRVLSYKKLSENEDLVLTEEFTLRLYSYDELEQATDGFKEELGRGACGTVYKGALSNGNKIVAVKRLEKVVGEGEREFRAEMRAIGRTHHRNLVRLLGFCAERSKKLLVYEYMSNGSLADLLFKAERRPVWKERVRIALDVARGILYLHEECEAKIIHCDIKPQNILMDDFWTAKISDFGLAKLLMPNQTRTFTGVRGTGGYLAPEWQKNAPISMKADVYSFGVVLLEIVCCRSNMEVNVSTADEIILSGWVYKCFVARELDKLVGEEEVDLKMLVRMVKVGLWCIQDEPDLRPSMKNVILMLEGIMDVPVPPPLNS